MTKILKRTYGGKNNISKINSRLRIKTKGGKNVQKNNGKIRKRHALPQSLSRREKKDKIPESIYVDRYSGW